MSRNCKADELERLTIAAQTASQTRFDLAAFAALTGDERARRWRCFDGATKIEVVTLALIAKHGDWTSAQVEAHVAKLDARWGAAPLATEAAVLAALEELETFARQAEATSRIAGLADDARFFARDANSYASARAEYAAGTRPDALGGRAYLLPSRTGGTPHLLRFDGDWRCSCKAGDSAHWAKALAIAIEYSADVIERDTPVIELAAPLGGDCALHGPYEGDRCHRCDVAALGQRIARVRASAGWATA